MAYESVKPSSDTVPPLELQRIIFRGLFEAATQAFCWRDKKVKEKKKISVESVTRLEFVTDWIHVHPIYVLV